MHMNDQSTRQDPNFVNGDNARPGTAYEGVIDQIRRDGVCPFCADSLRKYHQKPILKETPHWLVTDNMYPYTCARHHVLFIHRAHISHLSELSGEAWAELQGLLKEVCVERDIEGGTILFRFGNTKYTGASVTHLHAHLVQSDPDADAYSEIKSVRGIAARIG